MCTSGCRGNQRRPNVRVDEQKTQRPSSTEREKEKKSDFIFRRGVCCVWKMRRWRSRQRRGGRMDSVGEVSS